MTKRFVENHVSVFGDTLFKLLLKVAASVLILAKSRNLASQVFNTSSSKTVDYELEVK